MIDAPFPWFRVMHDHFRAGRARVGSSGVRRAVINHEDVIDLLERPLNDRANVFLLAIGRDYRRDLLPIHRARGR